MITRGIKHEVDRFVNDMQAQYFPYEWNGQKMAVQLAMRPIQLWEVVFPEDQLQNVMATVETGELPKQWKSKQKYLSVLRKVLGAKKLPKLDPNAMKRLVYKTNIQTALIGYREDAKADKDGHECL